MTRRHLEPLSQQIADGSGKLRHVLHEDVERERERVEVFLHHRFAVGERYALHVEQRVFRIVEHDEGDEKTSLSANLAHASSKRFLLVETTVRNDEHELLKLGAAAANLFSSDVEMCRHRLEKLHHRTIGERVILGERKLTHERRPLFIGERSPEGMERAHGVRTGAETDDADFADLQTRHGARQEHHRLERDVSAVVLRHRARIIDRQHDLILARRRSRSTEPDFILAEIARYVRNNLSHV